MKPIPLLLPCLLFCISLLIGRHLDAGVWSERIQTILKDSIEATKSNNGSDAAIHKKRIGRRNRELYELLKQFESAPSTDLDVLDLQNLALSYEDCSNGRRQKSCCSKST